MDPSCVWRLFLGHGWRHGRSWAAPINDLWGHHQEFTSHSLSSAYDLGKKPDPLYKGEAVRDFYQKMTIFLGMIH